MNSDNNELIDLWNNYAQAGYDNLYKSHSFQNIIKIMGEMFEVQSGCLVLDGGCGSGNVFSLINKNIKPRRIIGIDWSEKMLSQAAVKSKKINNVKFDFKRVDMTKKFPFNNNFFDNIVFNISICYFPNQGWKNALQEGHRVLKEDGHLYLSTFLKGWEFSEIMKKHKGRALKEAIKSPAGIYHGLKLKKHAILITKKAKAKGMEYPDKNDLDNLINALGFNILEEKEIFWGTGVAMKLKKNNGY